MSVNATNDQTLLSVAVSRQLLAEIDRKRGTTPRSTFVRECLATYLKIDLRLAAAPDRAGKGGRPKKAVALASVPGGGEKLKPKPEPKKVSSQKHP